MEDQREVEYCPKDHDDAWLIKEMDSSYRHKFGRYPYFRTVGFAKYIRVGLANNLPTSNKPD